MRKLIPLLFLLSCSNFSFGQTAKIDSLKQVLDIHLDDTIRVNALNELFRAFRSRDLSIAEIYYGEAKKLASKLDYPRGILMSKYQGVLLAYLKGKSLIALENTRDVKEYLNENHQLPKSISDKIGLSILQVEAVIYNNLGNKDNALKVHYKLIAFIEKTFDNDSKKYKESAALNYSNLSNVYYQYNDSLSLLYAIKAKHLAHAAPNLTYVGFSLLHEFLAAKELGMDVNYLNMVSDSALYYFKKLGDSYNMQTICMNKCSFLISNQLLDEAKVFCEKSDSLFKYTRNKYVKSLTLSNMATISLLEKKYKNTNKLLKDAIELSKQIGASELENDLVRRYAMSFDSIANYKMASHYKGIYIDSLKNYYEKELLDKFAEAETKFQSSEKEKQIAQQSLQIAQQENERSRILLVGILALLAATAIYFWYYTRQNKKKRQAELALQKQTIESEKLRELDQVKSNFFANISHEFRTPLTLILGPLDDMLKGTFKGNRDTYYRMMQRNGNRLLQLINQLLDLSRLESGKMILKASENDIAQLTKSIAFSFESLADSKEIDFEVQVPNKNITTYFEADKYEKILTNLLSNAFKFTPEGGSVSLLLTEKNNQVEVKITDSGIGIEQKDLPHIFDRFYQVDSSATREQSGSGIGLALTKELVNLHSGNIEAQSELEKGTVFTFSLPLGKAHLKTNQITNEVVQPHIVNKFTEKEIVSSTVPLIKSKQPIVLVVEDNADVRLFIKDKLKDDYQILEAENGKIGLAVANEQIPDLVISDVMMPEMDGYEFCKHIKTDERTSHIPVIMLTAKADLSDKIEGLETGADDYLTKPFNGEELLVRMHNLIEQRKNLREKFSSGEIKLKEVAVTSMDEEFLTKLLQSIETNLADERYGTEELASDMHLGRRQLLRKTKALTNQTPSKLIRSLRLQRAKELLSKGAGNVSEVSMQVGFNGLSYFIKCFKEEFGVLPSEV